MLVGETSPEKLQQSPGKLNLPKKQVELTTRERWTHLFGKFNFLCFGKLAADNIIPTLIKQNTSYLKDKKINYYFEKNKQAMFTCNKCGQMKESSFSYRLKSCDECTDKRRAYRLNIKGDLKEYDQSDYENCVCVQKGRNTY